MSLFRLPAKVKNKIDQLRKKICGMEELLLKKYALVAWSIVCKDKTQGGL
jgi:hypothetical protein